MQCLFLCLTPAAQRTWNHRFWDNLFYFKRFSCVAEVPLQFSSTSSWYKVQRLCISVAPKVVPGVPVTTGIFLFFMILRENYCKEKDNCGVFFLITFKMGMSSAFTVPCSWIKQGTCHSFQKMALWEWGVLKVLWSLNDLHSYFVVIFIECPYMKLGEAHILLLKNWTERHEQRQMV